MGDTRVWGCVAQYEKIRRGFLFRRDILAMWRCVEWYERIECLAIVLLRWLDPSWVFSLMGTYHFICLVYDIFLQSMSAIKTNYSVVG